LFVFYPYAVSVFVWPSDSPYIVARKLLVGAAPLFFLFADPFDWKLGIEFLTAFTAEVAAVFIEFATELTAPSEVLIAAVRGFVADSADGSSMGGGEAEDFPPM
jgi:hypothetical protein